MKVIIAIALALILDGFNAVKYADSIDNPSNAEFVQEIAFNEGIDDVEVTQQMFNNRYLR
jgi:hypothetical protein